jgi:hypothetical protein
MPFVQEKRMATGTKNFLELEIVSTLSATMSRMGPRPTFLLCKKAEVLDMVVQRVTIIFSSREKYY